MHHLTRLSSALAALAAATSAQSQIYPYQPAPPPPAQWAAPEPPRPAIARAKAQPIEPIELPASIDQGIDLIYIDPDIAPDVKRRSDLPEGMNLDEWSGAPIDLFTSVNPAYTELRRGLMRYSQRWAQLPAVQIPSGPALKAGSTDPRVALAAPAPRPARRRQV